MLFELNVDVCPKCKRPVMVPQYDQFASKEDYEAQRIKNHLAEYGEYSWVHRARLCKDCTATETERCFICDQERLNSEIEAVYYDVPFCRHCYETVSAKVWDEKREEAREQVR